MNHKEYELLIGIVSLIVSVAWGYKEIKEYNDLEDYWLKSYSIEIIGGLVCFFLIGIAGIYRYFS
ncbi:hypothetical protein [Maribacter sp. 2-571]|uniref:hypothetical protein n=1 Tax=Maribacter sp. 2-571 TaxID=3417569 RepID=UPI003D337FFB